MLKRITLLAGMALAAIALAVPASASALEWTHEEETFGGTASDTLSGWFGFGNPEFLKTKFECFSHAGFEVEGESTTGLLTSFGPTTAACKGEGAFAGCSLATDSTTIPTSVATGVSRAQLHLVGFNEVTLTTPLNEPIVFHSEYSGKECPITKSTLTVSHFELEGFPVSTLTGMELTGLATAHIWIGGVQQPAMTVAIWGELSTASDTITIS